MKNRSRRGRCSLAAVLAAAVLSVAAFEAVADGVRLDIAPEYWMSKLDGDIKISGDQVEGTRVDLVDILGIDDSEAIPGGRVTLRLGERNRFALAYFRVEHEGVKDLSQGVWFGGALYQVDDRVRSQLETTVLNGWYERTLVGSEAACLDIILGAQWTEMQGSLSSEIVGATSSSVEATTPVAGFAVEVTPGEKLAIRAEAFGTAINLSGGDAKSWDTRLAASYRLHPNFMVEAGYRYWHIDAEDDEQNEGDLNLSGPILSVALTF